jgi:hypothetical protein
MRAPTVLALFAAVLFLGVPAHGDPETPVQGTDGASVASPIPDSTAIPAPDAHPTAAPDSTVVPVHGHGAVATSSDTTQPPPQPTMPPEGYRGHRMMPQGRPVPPAPPDSTLASPAPVGPEVDTEFDEDKALEILIKSDPEAARRYRSPRKAFFLSLMVPGAGQVYCGSWVKATFFVAAEVSLGVGWYQVAIVKAREKEREAERYAALHWRQERYDSTWVRLYQGTGLKEAKASSTSPNRESFCDAIYGTDKGTGWQGCMDVIIQDPNSQYSLYSNTFSKGGTTDTAPGAWSQEQVLTFRSKNIKDLNSFYNVIGSQDLATGWEDNPDAMMVSDISAYNDAIDKHSTDPSIQVNNPWGVSSMQGYYLALRSRSDELARMQKWFLGGMILNHLAAAFDAALQAGRMNRELLQLQTSWLDGLGVQGGLAWSSGLPAMQARVDWSF